MYVDLAGGRIFADYLDKQHPGQKWSPIRQLPQFLRYLSRCLRNLSKR
jgi:hypothetical protein